MIHKVPRWVKVGIFILPAIAGMINSIIALEGADIGVSFMSGFLFRANLLFAKGQFALGSYFLIAILSFFFGSIISGIIIGNKTLILGRRYGVALLTESIAILVAYIFLVLNYQKTSFFILAGACGLQNAMVTTFSNAVVRTTHFTGIVTDIGSTIGNYICRRPINVTSLVILTTLLLGFLFGVYLGYIFFQLLNIHSTLIPAAILMALSILYFVYRRRHQIHDFQKT